MAEDTTNLPGVQKIPYQHFLIQFFLCHVFSHDRIKKLKFQADFLEFRNRIFTSLLIVFIRNT